MEQSKNNLTAAYSSEWLVADTLRLFANGVAD
jgi:hypothetical protein